MMGFTEISWILLFNFLIAAGISVFSFYKGYAKSHRYFTLMMLMIAEWALAATFESAALTISAKILWSQIEYIGGCTTAVFFLKYALGFTTSGNKKILRYFNVFWIIPAIVILLVFTNHLHHLVWESFEWSPAGNGILTYHHGPAFYSMIVYSLSLVLIGIAFIIKTLKEMPAAFRAQAKSVIFAGIIPFIAAFSYALGLNPVEGLDIIVISFVITGLVLLFGIYRFNIFSIIPLARYKIPEIMQEGVLITDPDYKIVFSNPAAKKMLKLNADFHFTDLSKISWLYNFCINQQNLAGNESELPTDDSSTRWFSVTIITIHKTKKNLEGYLIVLRDISNRKALETEARNLISDLHQSQKELLELNRQKDKLVSIIAHDLRTPFHQILSFARMLNEDDDLYSKEEIKEMTDGILQAGEQGVKILEDLLSWARTQRNTTETTSDEIFPSKILNEILPVFNNSIREKNLRITVNGDIDARVMANKNMLNIILRNLIANAVKFSNPGGEIQLNIAKGEPFHSIEVKDSGIGIPEEDLPKLFNIDVKYTRTGTSGEPGTGLGLILCKDLVIKNNGDLKVISTQGIGSSFIVSLPSAGQSE